MRLRLKYPVCVRPDPRTGEYDEGLGKRLIAAGIAVLETSSISMDTAEKRGRGRPRKA